MRIRIERTRMAMGKGRRSYAYDAYVSVDQCPLVDQYGVTTHLLSGLFPKTKHSAEYYTFEVATRPAEHWLMEKGWERYKAALAHEKLAKDRILEIARQVYPELLHVKEWPTFWVELPHLDASHETKWVEVPDEKPDPGKMSAAEINMRHRAGVL